MFAVGVAFTLGIVATAPNRLLTARTVSALAAPGWSLALYAIACVAAGGLVRMRAGSLAHMARLARLARLGAALSAFGLLLLLLGEAATSARVGLGPNARVALAPGAWVAIGLLTLFAAALGGSLGRAGRPAALAALLGIVAAFLASGGLDALSLVREAGERREDLVQALVEHCWIAGGALLLALAVAVPMTLAAFRFRAAERALVAVLSTIQTIPSIALFGLLLPLFSAIGAASPTLRALGLRGIGPAPAIVGIAAYLALPLVAGFLAGLRAAEESVVEAARGLGLTAREVLTGVRLPLGLPVFVGSLRTGAVQAVGLGALAALVGGGGLGTFVFQGVGQLAVDVVLLGALPIVGLALGVDGALGVAEAAAAPRRDG